MKFFPLSILISLALMPFAVSAQTDRDAGIALFNKGDYKRAVNILKRSAKSDPEGLASYYLGMAYLQMGKPKDGANALEKAVELRPAIAAYKVALGYAYLRSGDGRTRPIVLEALKLDPKNPEAHLILGTYNLYLGAYDAAYESTSKALEANPKLALAYRIRSEALIASFTLVRGAVIHPRSVKNELLFEATDNMQKYLELASPDEDTGYFRAYYDSLKFFSDHYRRREAQITAAGSVTIVSDAKTSTPPKITYQPRATYTAEARDRNVSGAVRLLIGLGADGKVGHILVLKPLGSGLDQQAVKAARSIKFEPATENGKPIPSVITREYTFTIY
jgi:TonB family protein